MWSWIMRVGSPTYGRHAAVTLSAAKANMLYIPTGVAHGFCVCSEEALMVYNLTTVHAPELDAGIRWDSAGIVWPMRDPLVSERDK